MSSDRVQTLECAGVPSARRSAATEVRDYEESKNVHREDNS
jgi:hypothetical protein